jgi:hypothetical protein
MARRASGAKVTADHEFIRDWVERRGGCPAAVKRPRRQGAASLKIEYPRQPGAGRMVSSISWDEFFDRFEQHKLAFQYQDTSRGLGSWKLIDRASLMPERRRRL